jgi:flagellar hook-basal body complex protein FliE
VNVIKGINLIWHHLWEALQLNNIEKHSVSLGQRFALGDTKVNLSDVMIASQKASVAIQTSVQVRNKVVAAYQSIMNMQI